MTKNKLHKTKFLKLTTILPILLMSVYFVSCGSNKKITKEKDNDDTIFTVVDQLPEFPGGSSGLSNFIVKTVRYPMEAKKNGVQGRVFVSFVVEKDGSISNVKIARGVDPLLNEEAARVIKIMPKWSPGLKKHKPVRVKYTIPINFSLH